MSKIGSVGPHFYRKGILQILDMHFQLALMSEHQWGFTWVPFSELWAGMDMRR